MRILEFVEYQTLVDTHIHCCNDNVTKFCVSPCQL